MTVFHLAQVNIAHLRAPLDDDALADFVAGLAPVNALAEGAPGFVWRLQDDAGDATAIPGFEWDRGDTAGVITNLSVWTDVDALKAFVRSDLHRSFLRRRAEWFHRHAEATVALWWVPAGTVPTVADAEVRVRHLREHGPTEVAFGFASLHPAPT